MVAETKAIHEKIIADLKWLAEKTDDPIVKITYGMASTIVDLHFGEFHKTTPDNNEGK
jgi:hypothetical protein